MELTKPTSCPACGAAEVLGICYGLLRGEALKAAWRGEFHAGGCLVQPEDWHCARCRHDWYVADDPARVERERRQAELHRDSVREAEERQKAQEAAAVHELAQCFLPAAAREGALGVVLADRSHPDRERPRATLVFGDRAEFVVPPERSDCIVEVLSKRFDGADYGVLAVPGRTGPIDVGCHVYRDGEHARVEISLEPLLGACGERSVTLERLPVCPECGGLLRTWRARVCLTCGTRWETPPVSPP